MHVDATFTLRSLTVAASDMTRRLAIDPDDSWEPGDSLARRRSPRMRRPDHGWVVRVAAADAAGALDALVARLVSGASALGSLLAESDTRVDVVVLACDAASQMQTAATGAEVDKLAAVIGTGLVVTGEMGAGSSRVCTWTTAAA